MSILSGILKGVAGVAAAPFTGGMSLIPTIASAAGDIAGGAAKGAASQRQADNQQMLSQDQLRNQQYGTQQGAEMSAGNLDLARKQFEEQARSGRAKQAVMADLLAHFSPTSVSVPGIRNATITGGLSEALKNVPTGQASLAELAKQALMAQMTPDAFSGGNVLAPPTMSTPKQAGALEKILGGVGLGGSLLGGIAGAIPGKVQPPGIAAASGMPAGVGTPVDMVNAGMAPIPSRTLADILQNLQAMGGGGR